MSKFAGGAWYAGETIALISILKSLKDLREVGSKRILDWQDVANQMAETQDKTRTLSELRERYKILRNDYFTARYHNRSCQYYNQLHTLFSDEVLPEKQENETDEEEEEETDYDEEDNEMEQKYADMLQLDCNGSRLPLRCKWADGEVEVFLNIITTLKLQTPLLRKRNAKVFKLLSKEMSKRNFNKRPDQLRIKYHQLRRQYGKAKNGGESFEHFEEMHALLNGTLEHGESSGGELDSDSNESDEEEDNDADGDAVLATESDSEGVLVAAMPKNARVKWAEGEVDIFLDVITSMGLQTALLRKRNAKIFRLLSKEMAKRNFDKPPEKLRIKFQQLRRQYNKTKNGGDTFEHFEAMQQLLNPAQSQPNAEPEANLSSGSESDFNDSDEGEADTSRRGGQADSYYWTDYEVDAFLSVIKEHNLFRALDGSKKRNFKTLAYISSILSKQSFKRTANQLRNKLRLLLRRYREGKQEGIKNVRMLPRHFQMIDDLMLKKRTSRTKAAQDATPDTVQASNKAAAATMETDSDASSFSSSCDLLRAAAESEDFEDTFEMPAEPTPLEVLTSISEGQKELLATLTTSHESFLQQQREMQRQFLQEMSNIMRQEREATFRMLRELVQPK